MVLVHVGYLVLPVFGSVRNRDRLGDFTDDERYITERMESSFEKFRESTRGIHRGVTR